MSKTNSATMVNGAEIKKIVVRSSRVETGFGFGRGIARSQKTSYIVRRNGRELGIVDSYRAAVALAS